MNNKKNIVFVYNANSDLASATIDWVHKLVSPNTYQCDLCALTHGHFGERKQWSDFIKNLPYSPVFLYRQDLRDDYQELSNEELPLVAIDNGDGTFDIIIEAKDMREMTLDDLQDELCLKIGNLEE